MEVDISQALMNILQSPKFYVPVLTFCITILIINSSSRLVKKLINKNSNSIEIKRRNTIVALLENIVKYIIIIFAILIILTAWGVNISGIIAGLGVAGAVAGLAIQDALKDIIMGCNIIMDNYFVVGDIVTFNNFTGEVIELGLKNTKIKNVTGEVLVVSNREISQIFNLSQKSATINIAIPVAYEEKEKKVAKVLTAICEEVDSWKETTDKTEYLGIDKLGDSSVDYLIRAHCKAGEQHALRRKILSVIKTEFDKNHIKIPYNQIEVHNG